MNWNGFCERKVFWVGGIERVLGLVFQKEILFGLVWFQHWKCVWLMNLKVCLVGFLIWKVCFGLVSDMGSLFGLVWFLKWNVFWFWSKSSAVGFVQMERDLLVVQGFLWKGSWKSKKDGMDSKFDAHQLQIRADTFLLATFILRNVNKWLIYVRRLCCNVCTIIIIYYYLIYFGYSFKHFLLLQILLPSQNFALLDIVWKHAPPSFPS